MAKELPYFQFEPAEYLTKDVSFCSLAAQGLFINICAYYWQRGCVLTKEQVLRRLDYQKELNELIEEGIIDIYEGKIQIKFLDEQWQKQTEKCRINKQNGSKGGRPKNQNKSELKPNANRNESESKGNRKEEIIKEEIIKEEKTIPKWLEFLNYAEEKCLELNYNLDESKLKSKYLAWKEAGWKTGKNKKIINWKSTLLNTLVYLRKESEQQSFTEFATNLLKS